MADTIDDGGPAFPVCPGHESGITDRFLARVDGGSDWAADRCWLWRGHLNPAGYGVFAPTKHSQFRAHRYALEIFLGRKPQRMVLHKCDNRACVNPMHLEEGDHGENMRQMAERRRATREDRHHKARLVWGEVMAINLLHRTGSYTTRELAAMFSMSQPTIAAITKGALWPDCHEQADAMLAERAKRGK